MTGSITRTTLNPYEHGACRGVSPQIMDGKTVSDVVEAQLICRTCPVVPECAALGAAAGGYGVWGGVLIEKGAPTARECLADAEKTRPARPTRSRRREAATNS